MKYLKLLQHVSDHKGSIIRELYIHINGQDRTITVILAKHCIELPDDKSLVIRNVIIIIIIIFLHGLGRLTCSGIDALPSFPGASTISSSSGFVVEGVFRQSGVVHSFKVVDPVLFVFWVSRAGAILNILNILQ